ncbi:hypothetical protein ACO0LG_04530 [Undibacterium sp. Ji42W]|uniref:hypothetical protein n=1 Tax=Undibacterium sp. Ji42W TaxID=3413039 RepID=UPI003BF43A1D
MKHRLVIARLKKNPGIWRVDGVSGVRSRWRSGKYATLHFAGIKDDHLHSPYTKHSLNGKILALPVHCAQLARFKHGSIWKEGQLVSFSPELNNTYTVDASRARVVKLSEEVEIRNELIPSVLPKDYFCFGFNSKSNNRDILANSRYVVVPAKLLDGTERWLIIPCTELVRFYFGVSSRLLASTIAGQIDDYFSYKDSFVKNGRVTIFAKKRLSRFEAGVLARTVASPDAKAAMYEVHNSISAAMVNNQIKKARATESHNQWHRESLDIKANFPFRDSTTLYASGKRIKLIDTSQRPIWGVYVMQIWRCSHSFGFFKPPIIQMEENSRPSNYDENNTNKYVENHFLEDEVLPDIEDVPANARAKRRSILDSSNQFEGMDGIRFKHVYKSSKSGNKGNHLVTLDIQPESLTFQDGSNAEDARNNQGLTLSTSQVDYIGRNLSLFIETIEKIANLKKDWSLKTPILGASTSMLSKSFLAHFPTLIANVKTWHLIDGRPRQVAVVEIEMGKNRYLYLLEMELKANESGKSTILLYKNGFDQVDSEALSDFFKLSARNNRWIGKGLMLKRPEDHAEVNLFLDSYQVKGIRHPTREQDKNLSNNKLVLLEVSPDTWAEYLVNELNQYGL